MSNPQAEQRVNDEDLRDYATDKYDDDLHNMARELLEARKQLAALKAVEGFPEECERNGTK